MHTNFRVKKLDKSSCYVRYENSFWTDCTITFYHDCFAQPDIARSHRTLICIRNPLNPFLSRSLYVIKREFPKFTTDSRSEEGEEKREGGKKPGVPPVGNQSCEGKEKKKKKEKAIHGEKEYEERRT